MTEVPPTLLDRVRRALDAGESLELRLGAGGRLHLDRPLPFLAVWRSNGKDKDQGIRRLVTAEASYLHIVAQKERIWKALLQEIARQGSRRYGSFLIIEVGVEEAPADAKSLEAGTRPFFRIRAPQSPLLDPVTEALEKGLKRIKVLKQSAVVEMAWNLPAAPSRMAPLLDRRELADCRAHLLALSVAPIYRHPKTGAVFPLVLSRLRRGVSRALKRAFFAFMTRQPHAPYRPPHYLALGRRALVHTVWEVDRRLSEVSTAFDFLLQVTPVNSASAWAAFKRSRYQKEPVFTYRPRPEDPVLLKRRLYDAPLERVEDPTLENLFREKQSDLDRKITMLQERETPRFLYESLQLYGGVTPALEETARELLRRLPPGSREQAPHGLCTVGEFARRAQEEVAYYRSRLPTFAAQVQVREDVVAGLMVSRGHLLISREAKIPRSRVRALLEHEVGTHLLTFYNARVQPLKLLFSGLAGYEELQEGQAVLAEYLVGGLSRPRLRLLAARVLAVAAMTEGASFVETFRLLRQDAALDAHTAFTVALRAHRGGGLTKDMTYLRGLESVLFLLAEGVDIRLLLIGKIAIKHVPMIQELLWRKVLSPAPLMPRYMEEESCLRRLESLRTRRGILDLVKEELL